MFPSMLLALPLLLPMSDRMMEKRIDLARSAPLSLSVPRESASIDRANVAAPRPLIPPLYAQPDGGFSISLSPGSPCTAACVKLQGTF